MRADIQRRNEDTYAADSTAVVAEVLSFLRHFRALSVFVLLYW
jgi:hypothetical protein